jgi:histidine phosphotransfer protein HptB
MMTRQNTMPQPQFRREGKFMNPTSVNSVQHLDYDALNSLKDVMEGEFGFLIDTFIQDSSDRLDKLYTLIGTDNIDAIRRAAHSFKGSCSNLGALHLANLCAALERKARENDLSTLGEDLADIEAEFLVVKQRMLAYLA